MSGLSKPNATAAASAATVFAWLPAARRPNGAILLGHLSQQHPDRVGPYLEQMRTEDIGTVAAQAFELIEDHQPEDDERRKR